MLSLRVRHSSIGLSVITMSDRKITYWQDYLDPIAVFDALGWP
jgi:hypothetical protein